MENIVMFPLMSQGHIIPFLALALHIVKKHKNKYKIIFVNTPLNIKRIKLSLPQTHPSSSNINFIEIPFNSTEHGLPPTIENSDNLPNPLLIVLYQATFSLRPAFTRLVQDLTLENHGKPPLCIIGDIFLGWTAHVAKEVGVFHAVFSGSGGFGLACFMSAWLNLFHTNPSAVDSEGFLELEDFQECSKIHLTQLSATMLKADGTESDAWSAFFRENFRGWLVTDGVLFNSEEKFDRIGLTYFKRKLNRPAWAIGPLLLLTDNRIRAGKEPGILPDSCKEWLDKKPVSSVLYVSFGSQNTLTTSQMTQLAIALEESGKNFIWVIRPPIGFDVNSEFKSNEWLPHGFEERIKLWGQGLLIHTWAPQVEILSHKSTGGFLSHCGWNSTLEALSHGVPILGWSMAGEQSFNVKFLEEELGVCVEIARGKNCEVRHETLKEKIELVMGEESRKGKEMREKGRRVMDVMQNAVRDEDGFKGSSANALDDFFQAAMSHEKPSHE